MHFTNILAVAVLHASSAIAYPAADAFAPTLAGVKSPATTPYSPGKPGKPLKPQNVNPIHKQCDKGNELYCCSIDHVGRYHTCVRLAAGSPCSGTIICCTVGKNVNNPCPGTI